MNGDILRWNPKTFPLKVFIDFNNTSQYPDYYNLMITKAFNNWEKSSGFLSFNFVTNKNNADIVIDLKGAPESGCNEAGCKYVIAHTEPIIKKHLLKKMIITIYDKDASGAFFSDKELYNTVLHEIGHSLGIMGHSYSTSDLMYMVNEVAATKSPYFVAYKSDLQYISDADINTLKLLYNIAPTVTNTHIEDVNIKNLIYPEVILGNMNMRGYEKLREAKNYIAEAPNVYIGYIDLAIAYNDVGDFKRALDAFNKALDLCKDNHEKFIVYYNIAALHLNNNKLNDALVYAEQAKALEQNEDILELISNIEHAINTNSKPFWSGWSRK